jgi:hypothetical protein
VPGRLTISSSSHTSSLCAMIAVNIVVVVLAVRTPIEKRGRPAGFAQSEAQLRVDLPNRPKVLNSTEDAHTKSMSTFFEIDEHLQALTPLRPMPSRKQLASRSAGGVDARYITSALSAFQRGDNRAS